MTVIMYFCILNYVYLHVTLSNPALRLKDPNKRLHIIFIFIHHKGGTESNNAIMQYTIATAQ